MEAGIIVNEGNGNVWDTTGAMIDILSVFAHSVAEGCGVRLIWREGNQVHTADFVGSVCVGYNVMKGDDYGASKA